MCRSSKTRAGGAPLSTVPTSQDGRHTRPPVMGLTSQENDMTQTGKNSRIVRAPSNQVSDMRRVGAVRRVAISYKPCGISLSKLQNSTIGAATRLASTLLRTWSPGALAHAGSLKPQLLASGVAQRQRSASAAFSSSAASADNGKTFVNSVVITFTGS
jgi:hypothetical protein